MKRNTKGRSLTLIISKDADRYIRSLARRTGVSPDKVLSLVVVMELDRLRATGVLK